MGSDTVAAELHALVGKLRRRLREAANTGDLTPSQNSALLRLYREGPMAISRLAELEGIRPQSMGAIVEALESQGRIQRSPDPNDGRRAILDLTVSARRGIDAGVAAREDWLARSLAARLSADEVEIIAQAIPLLQRLVDPVPEPVAA